MKPWVKALVVAAFLTAFLAPGAVHSQAGSTIGPEPQRAAPCPCGAPGSHGPPALPPPSGAPPDPTSYDEQLGMTFGQGFYSMAYNVVAVVQSDPTSGSGPAYLLNGLSDSGYWYQVGLSWNWNPGYYPGTGFDLNYEVFNPSGSSIFPTNGFGGLSAFNGPVNSGDSVLLNLYFSSTYGVVMLAKDNNTGATAFQTFSAEGGSLFVGQQSQTANANGFFTGLMTEWYHSAPFYGDILPVKYSQPNLGLTSAWMWADEFSCSNTSCSTRSTLFSDATNGPSTFTNPTQLIQFSTNGAKMFANAYTFITGAANFVQLTLSYSVTGGGNGYSAAVLDYYDNGALASAQLTTSPVAYLADPGSQWSVSASLPGSGAQERWETGQQTTGTASSTTENFEYFHQYYVTFGETVDGGGSGYSAPTVAYSEYGSARTTQAGAGTWADSGSVYTFPQTLPGSTASERWSTGSLSGTISSAGAASMTYYHQFLVSIGYVVAGGGNPTPPVLAEVEFGGSVTPSLAASPTGYWMDSGSAWSASGTMAGASGERWANLGTTSGTATAASSATLTYQHQYLVGAVASPAGGGTVPAINEWLDAGGSLTLNAAASVGWQFEGWTGVGSSAYTGSSASTSFALDGPVNETATFYPGLVITVSGGGSVTYSYGSTQGTVSSGMPIFVPVGTTVTLTETPSSFLYSFGGWGGGSLTGSASQQQVQVSAPVQVTATFGLNVGVIGGIVGGLAAAIAASVFVMRRRRQGLPPPPPLVGTETRES